MFQPEGTSKVVNTSAFQIPITSSETKDSINVPYLHPDQPVTYLGRTSQPDGNQSAPFKLVLNKTTDFTRRMVSTNMSRQLITMTNISIINPTIKYPLTSTCFNDQQIDTIHTRLDTFSIIHSLCSNIISDSRNIRTCITQHSLSPEYTL